jgi:hypothetical protein
MAIVMGMVLAVLPPQLERGEGNDDARGRGADDKGQHKRRRRF